MPDRQGCREQPMTDPLGGLMPDPKGHPIVKRQQGEYLNEQELQVIEVIEYDLQETSFCHAML